MQITGRKRIVDVFNSSITIIQDFWSGRLGHEILLESETTLGYSIEIERKILELVPWKYYIFEIDSEIFKVKGVCEWEKT